MEKFEKLDNDQKELVKYWITKHSHRQEHTLSDFIEKHLTPEPVIEVGIWVKAKNPSSKFMVFIESLDQPDKDDNSVKSYGFSKSGEWMYSELRCPSFLTRHCVKATPAEVEQRLIEEAKRKGLSQGNSIISTSGIVFKNILGHWVYGSGLNKLYYGGAEIFDNGKWADIIDEKAEIRATIEKLRTELSTLEARL